MPHKSYRAITPGRSLFNCNPSQFEHFVRDQTAYPRTGLLAEAAERLGYEIDQQGSLWYAHNADGIRFVEAEPNRRQAFIAWWKKVGMTEVLAHRREHQEYEDMGRPGRPRGVGEAAEYNQERVKLRETLTSRLNEIWTEASEILTRHTAQAALWVDQSVNRELPRRNTNSKVGEKRAMLEALANLYDVDHENEVISACLNGEVRADPEIAAAVMQEWPELAARGEFAAIPPRMALVLALLFSPSSAEDVFSELREVMTSRDIETTEGLGKLCVLART